MSRFALAAGLLALACGGESGLFRAPEEGAAGYVGDAGTAGSGGALVSSGGSDAVAGADESGGAGKAPIGGSGGVSGTEAGTGGSSAGAASDGGWGGGQVVTAGAGGQGGGGASGGSAGTGTGGVEPREPMCKIGGWMDCNGILDDGNAHLMPDDCETPMLDHDNCGECGHKCGLSQQCMMSGKPGAWVYGCKTP